MTKVQPLPKVKTLDSGKKKILTLVIMLSIGFNMVMVMGVAGQPIDSTHSFIFIESRFILWDEYEKMLDSNFIINIIYLNSTDNNTASYHVTVDGQEWSGTLQTNVSINVTVTQEVISLIEVKVNNETQLKVHGVIIMEGVSGSGIRRGRTLHFIEMLPTEWKAYQWNEFFAVSTGVLLAIVFGYRLMKRFRMKQGGVKIA